MNLAYVETLRGKSSTLALQLTPSTCEFLLIIISRWVDSYPAPPSVASAWMGSPLSLHGSFCK